MTIHTPSRLAILLGGWFFSMAALAQDDSAREASVSIGYVGTTGNTETQTFNTEVLYSVSYDNWEHNAKFQGLGAQENSETKAERYYLENKSDYQFSERNYAYGKGTYTDDRFSGFNYQTAVSGGLGRHFIMEENLSLDAFSGIGYRYNDTDIKSEGEMIFSLGENLAWDLNDSTSLTQSLVSDIGQELTVTRFEIGLVSNILGQIATKIAFQARNTTEVPPGRENTDTQTSVSLVYEF